MEKGWLLNIILSTLSREVNVALLYRRIQALFWKGSKLFVIDPAWPALHLYLNFYEYEMLIEREFAYFAYVSLLFVNNLLRIRLISFSHRKN